MDGYTKLWTCGVIKMRRGTDLWNDLTGEPYKHELELGETKRGTLSSE